MHKTVHVIQIQNQWGPPNANLSQCRAAKFTTPRAAFVTNGSSKLDEVGAARPGTGGPILHPSTKLTRQDLIRLTISLEEFSYFRWLRQNTYLQL
jgi:hypothetical protein